MFIKPLYSGRVYLSVLLVSMKIVLRAIQKREAGNNSGFAIYSSKLWQVFLTKWVGDRLKLGNEYL